MVTLWGCAPSPTLNVAGYLLTERLGTSRSSSSMLSPGLLAGRIVDTAGHPVAGAVVVIAEQNGQPHSSQTNEHGYYLIKGVPPGNYTPAASASGYHEVALQTLLGTPDVVTIQSERLTVAPIIELTARSRSLLSQDLAREVKLVETQSYQASAPYPEGSVAQVFRFAFTRDRAKVDTLRLYIPLEADTVSQNVRLPLLFMVYPTRVDLWESVSVAFAAQGFGLVAISPVPERGLDIDAHAQDAHVGLTLATSGLLHPRLRGDDAVALGGSFSSAVLSRLLRDAGDQISAWITIGGIGNAFSGAAEFYAGRVQIPHEFRYLIPALGTPRLHPLPFLRYSPVYAASQLPPTLIIHTAADTIIPIAQARELEQALRSSEVAVEVFYYDDVSHYLQIDENLTPAGKEMFGRILAFIEKYGLD